MIALTRERTTRAVPARFRGDKRVELQRELLEMARDGTLEFKSSIWKVAKAQLKREASGKCAYCESPTETVAHGDVEHYRPKSVYWWLAYCYDNYLFACQICNQTYKGDNFPCKKRMRAPTVPTTEKGLAAKAITLSPDALDSAAASAFAKKSRAEGAYLLDPYNVDPAEHFAWAADDALREVSLVPANNKAATKRLVAEAMSFYGLNRDELRRWRYREYEALLTLRLVLEDARMSESVRNRIRTQIEAMTAADAPYSAMCTYFVAEWGIV